MAHDDAAVRQSVEEFREELCEIGVGTERIGAGKGRIGAHAVLGGKPSEAPAQSIENEPFWIGKSFVRKGRPRALAQPRLRGGLPGDTKERFTHLWKHMNMLVAVDEVRRAGEGGAKRGELTCDLGLDAPDIKRAREPALRHRRKRRERALALRREVL